MRCPDCNKFVSFDADTEPEVSDEEVSEEGLVTASVRIVNACAECGTELTEASFDLEIDLTKECLAHIEDSEKPEDAHEFTVDFESARNDRSEGRGRAVRTFYEVAVDATVTCACDDETWKADGHWEDDVRFSEMEEL